MRSAYDPFNRDEELALEREAAAREEHERWSFEQSRLGRSAAQRENAGVWVSTAIPLPPLASPPAPRS